MDIQTTLLTQPFIIDAFIQSSIDHSGAQITAKFPIQHHIKTLQSLLPKKIIQDIPAFITEQKPHPKVKNILAIASGKGGVGKSTVTYYLAQALQHMGAKVGVLDADIYGPSQGLLFNLDSKPSLNEQNDFIPFKRHGIEVMSIGVLSSSEKALMWRGPMISQALVQLYQKTHWSALDYLLIDLPPGTGDIPLTLVQKIPVTASILVSNPHPLTKLDVDKCAHLFNHLKLPIITTLYNQSSDSNNPLHIPHHALFQSMKPCADPGFISIAEYITQKLTQYNVPTPNPFDRIAITKNGE